MTWIILKINLQKTLKNLINNVWHTSVTVNAINGKAKFRGFYGDYKSEIDGEVNNFSIHKK